MKKLSIVIPVYNVEIYLEECLQSIYDHLLELQEFEVVAINDGSTDKSLDILKKYSDLYPNFIVYSQVNKGQSAARNMGLRYSSGKYVFFMDSDDFIYKNTLKPLLDTAIEHDLDVLRFEFDYVSESGIKLGRKTHIEKRRKFVNKLVDGSFLYEYIYNKEFYCLSLLKRDFLLEYSIEYKEGVYFEDIEYAVKLAVYAKRVLYTDVCVYAYRQRSTSTIYTFNKKKIEDILFIISCLQSYLQNEVLTVRFRKCIDESITNLMCTAIIRTSELESIQDRCDLKQALALYEIKHLNPTGNLKELVIGTLYNFFNWRVVSMLTLLLNVKKRLI